MSAAVVHNLLLLVYTSKPGSGEGRELFPLSRVRRSSTRAVDLGCPASATSQIFSISQHHSGGTR